MPEPAKARHEATGPDIIRITFNPANGYGFNPSDSTALDGTVEFIAPQACWVWTFSGTSLVNAFNGEQSDHVQCAPGANNFTAASQYWGTVITVVGTNIGAPPPPPPPQPTETLKGTIHVGSTQPETEKY